VNNFDLNEVFDVGIKMIPIQSASQSIGHREAEERVKAGMCMLLMQFPRSRA
jgi:hypothetical protein